MERPEEEIIGVVSSLTMATSPDIQEATIQKFFAPDAGFRHPLCAVKREPGSRQSILGIYQWYRIMSPRIILEVKDVVYDRKRNVIFLEIEQKFHLRFNPLPGGFSRLITRLELQEQIDGLHYITLQEDFYHPSDFAALIIPPLRPFIEAGLRAASLVCSVNAYIARTIGPWRFNSRVGRVE
ncbi:hypothetical protein FRC18_005310 [Serendipita sp. 400]|nr:hypothetical protein FRC18_005310 [Serendipita sp. 400]